MRNRKKLVVDSDQEPTSPQVLFDQFSLNNQLPHQSQRQNTTKTTVLNNKLGDYLVSIIEPSSESHSSHQGMYNHSEQASRQSSLAQKSHFTGSQITGMNPLPFRQGEREKERSLNTRLSQLQDNVRHQKGKNSCKLMFQKNNILQTIVQSQKIKNIKDNFIKKIRRTSTLHPPAEYKLLQQEDKDGVFDSLGFQMSPFFQSLINLFSVVQIFSLLLIYSTSFVFENLLNGQYSFIEAIQIGSCTFYLLELILNLVTVKFSAGRRIEVIRDIIDHYMSQTFWVDLASLVILLIDISTHQTFIAYFRVFIIFKLPQALDKIEQIEVQFIRNVYNQQYWELAKVFIVNFCYAHIIALVLGAMTSLSPHDSWFVQKGIVHANWGQKYVWSAYWATNIMLTVGFGDLSAANHKEAICLIFIETLSCIIMAYNINRVGSIINNIRLEDQNRSKKFKIFKKLTDQNSVSQELTFKINNYIEESSKLKKKFNYEEDQEFLKELPRNLRTTYLREANREILSKLVFFRSLLDKTLYNFSEQLQTKISHPQQIIRSLEDDFNLLILKKGHLGYICKKSGCGFNDSIVDEIKVNNKDLPYLTSLDFISKVRPRYEIKSLQFSVLFTLSYQKFIQIFRKSDMDYQLFCFLRDKCKNIPDEFEVKPCEFCTNYNHFKFTCPRLHYVPYQQHVINKYIHQEKIGNCIRRQFQREKKLGYTPMQYYKKVKNYRNDQTKGRTRNLEQRNILQSSAYGNYSALRQGHKQSDPMLKRTNTVIDRLRDDRIREVIQEQLLKRQKQNSFEDDPWIIRLDVMNNFNGYFSKDNPKYVGQKFSREARFAQRKLRYKVGKEEEDSAYLDEMVDAYKIKSFTEQTLGKALPSHIEL